MQERSCPPDKDVPVFSAFTPAEAVGGHHFTHLNLKKVGIIYQP